FVIFDQPSQVYFPKRLADKSSEEGYDPEFDDEDVKAVHKLFSTLSAAIMDMSGRCQAIVLDHASETVWGGIPGIFKVDEWRGKKLIPQEWL
ncbi:MAG: DUF3732 domain-containing protein, partial [Acidobacteria bacterium]|nr:DUF3732 domain-containing protein [Acidobacteriota bacterium]